MSTLRAEKRRYKGTEKRKHKRYPFKKNIFINKMRAKAIDISEGGMFVHTGRSSLPGSITEITIPFMDEKIKVFTKVQHYQKGVGMGLMFIDFDDDKKHAILSIIDIIKEENGDHDKGKISVLLVDENDVSRLASKSKLVLEGFSVIERKDGKEAIEVLKSQTPSIDVIVLEPFTKDMDGFDVLTVVKRSSAWKKIPIIVFTANGSLDAMKKFADKGADEVLAKVTTTPLKLSNTVKVFAKKDKVKIKQNCWEFHGCGREPGGANVKEQGICVVTIERKLNGVHSGENAGRACWSVLGTIKNGKMQSTFSQKYRSCEKCEFYKMVRKDEGENCQDTIVLLSMLEKK
jgi:CheY-like chemotaxis protein